MKVYFWLFLILSVSVNGESCVSQVLPEELPEILVTEKVVMIDFFADWCPPCKRMMPIYSDLALEYASEDVLFLKVDIGDRRDVWEDYGIATIPCFIVFKEGEETFRCGSTTRETLEEAL